MHKVQLQAGCALIGTGSGLLTGPAEWSHRVLQRAEHLWTTIGVLGAGANLATAALNVASYRRDGSAAVLARRRHASVGTSHVLFIARTTSRFTYSVVCVPVEYLVALRSARKLATLGML